MPGLTFVTLLAYDYRYAFTSIRSYYDIADEIILGLDSQRLTWMKQPFTIDLDEVHAYLRDVDPQGKARIVEGDWHSEADPMVNELLERSCLSHEAAPGNWVVQIDADEVLVNGPEFRQWLLSSNPEPYDVFARWISVFKTFGNQVLLIAPPNEPVPVATMMRGAYCSCRLTAQPALMSPLRLLHFSWGRTANELMQKLANWGHRHDFDIEKYYKLWESVDLQNYTQLRDFHPLNGPAWPSLQLATLDFDPAAPYRPTTASR